MTSADPSTAGRQIAGVYAIIDPAACRGRDAVAVARAALAGGARVLQWRDKTRDKGAQLPDARAISQACHDVGAIFIVNDHVDLALAAGADGVHLGQTDLPLADARAIAPRMILGASTNNAEEAAEAVASTADYVAIGAIFPTSSKDVTRPADLERIVAVKAAVSVPVVAIGGINASNIAQVVAAGADAAAVISAICGADDPEQATRELVRAFAATGAER